MAFLDEHLAAKDYFCECFTGCGFNAFVTCFARVVNIRSPAEHRNLQAWFDRIKSRPSAKV